MKSYRNYKPKQNNTQKYKGGANEAAKAAKEAAKAAKEAAKTAEKATKEAAKAAEKAAKAAAKAAPETIFAEYSKAPSKINIDTLREQINLLNEKTVNTKDKHSSSILHNAIRHANEELVALLLEKGANINEPNKLGWTPLHTAVEFENVKLVKLLIEKGARTDIRDKSGDTPLENATEHMSTPKIVEIISILNRH